MGLLINQSLNTGETKNCYLRINHISGQKTKEPIMDSKGENIIGWNNVFKIFVSYDIWASKDIFDNSHITGNERITGYRVTFNGNINSDLYIQAYTYLKAFPDGTNGAIWSSSTDVI